jgi:hypothetical protein
VLRAVPVYPTYQLSIFAIPMPSISSYSNWYSLMGEPPSSYAGFHCNEIDPAEEEVQVGEPGMPGNVAV